MCEHVNLKYDALTKGQEAQCLDCGATLKVVDNYADCRHQNVVSLGNSQVRCGTCGVILTKGLVKFWDNRYMNKSGDTQAVLKNGWVPVV